MFKFILSLCIFWSCNFSALAQFEAKEYNLKAAFLFNFTKYVEWDTVKAPINKFVIGVLGECDIIDPLNEIAKTKNYYGKEIVIVQFNSPDVIDTCHILFIPHDTPFNLPYILRKTSGENILTVSEKSGYAAKGTAINFIKVSSTLKFEANTSVIESSGLKVSSQLLKLATIVNQ